ncbi:MAG: DUF6456 domain-containing protein [Pseudomonadota bacterium]
MHPDTQHNIVSFPTKDNAAPEALYIAHVINRKSLRALARDTGLNASTVMRRVRKVEERREDPLIDQYFTLYDADGNSLHSLRKDGFSMAVTSQKTSKKNLCDKEELRILRRMSEKDAMLVINQDLEKGVVLRCKSGKEPTRTAVVTKELAMRLTLKEWIKLDRKDKVSIYKITPVGLSALRRAIGTGMEEAQSEFSHQHREFGERVIAAGDEKPEKIRVNLRESPLTILGRKKDKNGEPFLSRELLAAGERLREDFELAQMGPRTTLNWDRFINGGAPSGHLAPGEGGSGAAQRRLADALSALGTGLGDIALRTCCFLEGLETAEKRMGWSARSGKIVLRIALQRLRLHYEEDCGESAKMIG